MPRIEPKPGPGSPFGRLMSHRPDIRQSWDALDEKIRFTGILPPELKEEVRRALAQTSGCAFCASLGTPLDSYTDARTKAAVDFAKRVGSNPTRIDDATFDLLRPSFTNAEIVELVAWITFMFASEMFGAIFKLDPATPEQQAMYSRWLKNGMERESRHS